MDLTVAAFRDLRRLPLPAEPGTAPPPAQERRRRRTCVSSSVLTCSSSRPTPPPADMGNTNRCAKNKAGPARLAPKADLARKVPLGLVGTGYWAGEVHAPSVAGAETVQPSGVWGRDALKARRLADRFGATAYSTPGEILSNVDAVTLAVFPSAQAALAVQAARAGCHLLLERATALTIEECRGRRLRRRGCRGLIGGVPDGSPPPAG